MAYNGTNPVVVGAATKKDHYDRVFDNTAALRTGAFALASQAARDILFASGASQWARLAAGTSGDFLQTKGAGADPEWASALGGLTGSPDIKVGRSPGRSDQELCDLGRNRLIHGFFWDLPEQYFLASVDGRLRRPRSGWGACSAAAKSRRKVFNL